MLWSLTLWCEPAPGICKDLAESAGLSDALLVRFLKVLEAVSSVFADTLFQLKVCTKSPFPVLSLEPSNKDKSHSGSGAWNADPPKVTGKLL